MATVCLPSRGFTRGDTSYRRLADNYSARPDFAPTAGRVLDLYWMQETED
ncbi:MAG: hypothetical protein IID05_01300 [Gemmatimonadetes bacterium]|nr:hypothetical protein [Gemmatimonadota bacterium]